MLRSASRLAPQTPPSLLAPLLYISRSFPSSWVHFLEPLCYPHVAEGSFLLLYLLHEGVSTLRTIIVKGASQTLKMPGKTRGNLQLCPLLLQADGDRVALETRDRSGKGTGRGMSRPLSPPSATCPAPLLRCCTQRPWGLGKPSSGAAMSRTHAGCTAAAGSARDGHGSGCSVVVGQDPCWCREQ